MPTYEYACSKCGHEFEVVQSFSDAPITSCPQCQGEVKKVFSNVGVVFKGSGFYKTDSRKTETKSTKPEAKSETKTESKKVTKTESKPATPN